MSPGASAGVNENGVPQFRQNPATRPGSPSRPRPTGSSHFRQYRPRSGTCGLAMIACSGSTNGTAGTGTKPPPSRPWAVLEVVAWLDSVVGRSVLLAGAAGDRHGERIT